ncbi:MAG: hypothetical protein KDK78_07090 [Chlamydiia bacterium]|nr:hypothetical protein [Chlamydiia bacterium]
MRKSAFVLLLCFSFLGAESPRGLYQRLDPTSIPQHLALYQRYPDSPEGKQALADAWALLGGDPASAQSLQATQDLALAIPRLLSLLQGSADKAVELSESELALIEQLSACLPHHQLAFSACTQTPTLSDLKKAPFDLARVLLLSQCPDNLAAIRSYEALLDLMALQVRARVPENPSPDQLITEINRLLFSDLWFRFPPHSKYAEDIDEYTFLTSVLDGRRGVCLGISTLYLCLAQRLGLDLEIVTPPGHIYVRYRDADRTINIETTARGVHLDNRIYLSVNTRSLQQRELWELPAMAFFNQAAVHWRDEDPKAAQAAYARALSWSPDDPHIKQFYGLASLCAGDLELAHQLLSETVDYVPDDVVSGDTLAKDVLSGRVDGEGIAAVLMHVDESRGSIEAKQRRLRAVLERFPDFQGAWFALAITYLQLSRPGEALDCLERCHAIQANDITVEYYLAALHCQRLNYPAAWRHADLAEAIANSRNHNPRVLQELRSYLMHHSPKQLGW